RPHARRLYQWLIEPFQSELASREIDTLVFVPDGILRTVPMSALYDGRHFLIEKYAVAITPGMELTDPRPLDRQQLRGVFGGLSKAVRGFPALAHVSGELQSIQQSYGGTLLLNEDFQLDRLQQSLSDERLNVLHIATHAEFKGDIDNSFLLTFDGRLTINELADYVGLFRFRKNPLELLVLSACETAQGDDRAALGLSGVAIKAGARSALGALWKVNDVATSRLISDFYEQLKDPAVSRAVALQRAQRDLIEDLSYRHPGYWSAFLLLNSWL
ncbi:MAG: CHAT domain-containing protein, partial [Rhodobacteraceae bacterium]|nr:CHAT domain-containing protein [Paracoccaceae bacterium]